MKEKKQIDMKSKATRNILLFLLAFLGLGAVFGGAVIVISPSGKLFGMPLSMLENSPFSSFFIPGIILFLVLGIVPMVLFFALLKKPNNKRAERFNFFKDMHWSWSFTIYVAFALIGWIQMEMFYVQSVHWSHIFYMFLAVVILFVALLPQVRGLYKK
jgi:hypothetical protein